MRRFIAKRSNSPLEESGYAIYIVQPVDRADVKTSVEIDITDMYREIYRPWTNASALDLNCLWFILVVLSAKV